jgi:hypothetical protein
VHSWRFGDEIPLGNRSLRVIRIRGEDDDQPPVLVVEDMAGWRARVESEIHANYLRDLGFLLRERGEEAKREAASADNGVNWARSMAYYQVLHLMVDQAEAFGLPLVDLALDGFDPEDLQP